MTDQKHKVVLHSTPSPLPLPSAPPLCPSPLPLLSAPPLCPPPGEGGTETPPRVGPCLEEEDLPVDTEETLWARLIHEEGHNKGRCTTVE